MSQLKDSVVTGNLRVTDIVLTDTLQTDAIKARSSSSSTTITTGTDGQILKTNGTSVYWGNESDTTFANSPASNITSQNITDWNNKQDELTFDSTPTNNSTNPVTSGGLYNIVLKDRPRLFFGTCDTAAATAAKTVTCESFTSSDLDNGTMMLVKFSTANSAAVADLTMNVNNTEAISIKKIYNYAIANLTNAGEIRGTTNLFILSKQSTSIYWILVGIDYNANTTYSVLTQSALDTGTATTARTINASLLRTNFYTKTETDTAFAKKDGTSTQFLKADGSKDSTSYLAESDAILSRMQDDTTHRTVTDTDKTNWNSKQSALVSGSNIKTINNTSLLGSGNISIPSGKSAYDLWLDAGNSGTEADFLASLQGPSGYSGAANELQVINDLTTGGTTDALSAEMGKFLSDCIGAPDLIDITNMTTYTGNIASATGLWATGTNRKFILIPVEYYYKILVKATSTNTVGLAWLKSYSGVVVGESPDFADNTTIWLQPISSEVTYEVPIDAHYLYIYVGSVYPEKVLGIRYNNQYSPNQVNLNLISYSKTTGSYIDTTSSLWSTTQSTWGHILVPNNNYKSIRVVSDSTNPSRVAFLTQNDAKTDGSTPSYAGSTSLYKANAGGDTNTYLVPDGTKWIYIYSGVDGNYLPSSVVCYKNTSGDIASIVNTNSENDFEIVDSNKNSLLILNNGHIKTLNFDSSKVVPTIDYSRRNFFTYNVNCNNFLTTNFSSTSINYYDPIALYEDNAILYLPSTYTHQGPKTKLIIYCKEGSTYMTSDHDSILTNPEATRYFLHLGYAILAADGVPDGWKTALGLTERAVGNYVAVQSTLRAFEYVKNNFNIDCDNVFIFGYSQGGMYAENVIDNTNIPVTAAVLLAPALSMRYHQWDAALSVTVNNVSFSKGARLNIARMFNFPEVSNDTQLLALEYDPDKVCGYDPWTRNVENPYTGFVQGTTYGASLWGLPSGTSLNDITMKKFTKCPTKIWASENDATLGVDISKVFVKAIKNSGQVADLQLYNTGAHHPHDSQTAITTFTENGENVSLLPMYMDMAAWYYNFGGLALQ